MEEVKLKIPDILEHVTELAEKKVELIQLEITEKSSKILSSISVMIVLAVFAIFTILFAGLSCGWWLSELTGSASMGFLFTTFIFLMLFLLIWLVGRKPLQNMVVNWVIKGMLYDK